MTRPCVRRALWTVGLVAAALAIVALPAVSASAAARPAIVFRLQDPRIDEASGISPGIRSPGVDYVENDSGDTHRFFALNARTGATAVDWEDLQVARDATGAPCVWLADIGDNGADRSEVEVYRLPEPRIDPDAKDVAVTGARPDVWRLRYPHGPADAESLAVTPRGDAYIVTKNMLGVSDVYRLPPQPDPDRVQAVTQVGTIAFTAGGGSSPVGAAGGLLATSAAVSPDGRLLAVRSYTYALVWRLHPTDADDGVAAALRTAPTRVTLPAQPQGEGIAFDRGRLLVDSEGVGTPVWSVPLPAAPTVASTESSSAPSTRPAVSTTPRPSPSGTSTVPAGGGSRFRGLSILIIAALLGTVVLLGRRARSYGSRFDRRD